MRTHTRARTFIHSKTHLHTHSRTWQARTRPYAGMHTYIYAHLLIQSTTHKPRARHAQTRKQVWMHTYIRAQTLIQYARIPARTLCHTHTHNALTYAAGGRVGGGGAGRGGDWGAGGGQRAAGAEQGGGDASPVRAAPWAAGAGGRPRPRRLGLRAHQARQHRATHMPPLDPVDWAYVLARRANIAHTHAGTPPPACSLD